MICSKCNSQWESKINTDKCPFCGTYLLVVNTDNMTVSQGISSIISEYGLDTLNDSKRFLSLIMDFVRDCDKEKKLLRIACNCGILKDAIAIKGSKDDQRELLIKKAIKKLEDEAFLSFDNAEYIISLILQGLGILYSRTAEEKQVHPKATSNSQTNKTESATAQQPITHQKVETKTEPVRQSQANFFQSIIGKFSGNEKEKHLWSIVNENRRPTNDECAAILDLGRKLLKTGNTAEGIKLVKFTSQYGYAYGSLLLGYCYDKGIGVVQDSKVATAYYERAGVSGGADESFKFHGWNDRTHRSRAYAVAEKIYNDRI